MRNRFTSLLILGLLCSQMPVSLAEDSPFEKAEEVHTPVRRTSSIGNQQAIERSVFASDNSVGSESVDSNGRSTASTQSAKHELTGKLKPSTRGRSSSGELVRPSPSGAVGQWMTTLLGLAIVIGLILSFAYAFRKHIPLATKVLPADIVEVLGRRYIDQRNCVQLIRCGNRILIVAHSPTHGLQTLGEINDPVEVDTLAGRCKQSDTASTTSRFEELVAGQFRSKRDRSVADTGPSLDDEEVSASGLRLPRNPLGGAQRRELPHA